MLYILYYWINITEMSVFVKLFYYCLFLLSWTVTCSTFIAAHVIINFPYIIIIILDLFLTLGNHFHTSPGIIDENSPPT